MIVQFHTERSRHERYVEACAYNFGMFSLLLRNHSSSSRRMDVVDRDVWYVWSVESQEASMLRTMS